MKLNITTLFIVLSVLPACQQHVPCQEFTGRFTNGEGIDLLFANAHQLYWLTKFGSQTDTQSCNYQVDCQKHPAEIDLNGFTSGPYVGKTLLGILEWNSDSSFRIQMDMGNRPPGFEQVRLMEFTRKTTE